MIILLRNYVAIVATTRKDVKLELRDGKWANKGIG
jgi:hypothetical protein